MSRWWVVAVVACGCGRIAFEPVGDDGGGGTITGDGTTGDVAQLAHDEDSDGIPDTIDTCPMTPDATNADADGDGVGDICDSDPTIARQHWLLFESMSHDTLPFLDGPTGAWTRDPDDWHYADSTPQQAQLLRGGTYGNLDLWVGLDVEQLGTGGVQAAIIINGTNLPYYYGELFDGGSGAKLQIIRYDGSSFIAVASTPIGGGFPLGRTDIYFAARTSPTSFTIAARGQAASNAATSYVGDTLLLLGLGHHSGRVLYVGIVELQ